MTLQLSPMLALAPQYGALLSEWDGEMVVRTVHGPKKSYRVSPSDTIDLTEVGVLISWRGDDPTGVFLPYSEVTAIEQIPEGSEPTE